jgi:hypothetical protein
MPEAALTPAEIADLTRLARRALWAPVETRRAIQAGRVNVVPANFYSTVPLLDEIGTSFEYATPGEEHYNGGLFDPAAMTAEIAAMLPFAAEFDPPLDGDREAPAGFFWRNPAFSFSDAVAYYAMIRRERPRQVVEVGSGFSTLVADMALRRNGEGSLVLIEPYPKPFLRGLATVERLIERPVQAIPVPELAAMVEAAGMWFIDSTHTVKTGSDCLWLYLKVMPALARDVLIHAHDIFLPFGMPRGHAMEKHIYWTEQYLLYAYLLGNSRTRVVFSSTYAQARLRPETDRLMHGRFGGGGGSIWFRQAGADAQR